MGVRRESLMWAGRDVMPFSKGSYEKGLLSANSWHSAKGKFYRKYLLTFYLIGSTFS